MVPVAGMLLWDWRESYVVLLALVVPGVLILRFPVLVPVIPLVLVAVGLGVRVRTVAGWWRLLRSGEVVTVDGVEESTDGSGTVRVAHATGWRVERGWFTGALTDSTITYTIAEQERSLALRGLPYTSGVILAHPSRPDAVCVSAFPFDLRLRENERWSVSIASTFWFGALATAALYAALACGAVITVRNTWF